MEALIPKWHRELELFSAVKPLLILEGNITDQYRYPVAGSLRMDEIAPRRGYFVHMCHDVKHAEFEARLPRRIRLTYDGMKIRV